MYFASVFIFKSHDLWIYNGAIATGFARSPREIQVCLRIVIHRKFHSPQVSLLELCIYTTRILVSLEIRGPQRPSGDWTRSQNCESDRTFHPKRTGIFFGRRRCSEKNEQLLNKNGRKSRKNPTNMRSKNDSKKVFILRTHWEMQCISMPKFRSHVVLTQHAPTAPSIFAAK